MVEIYISWVKGLLQDKTSLEDLKRSGIITGIELSNTNEQVDMIKDAGLKFSSHNPGITNLASQNYMNIFNSIEGINLLKTIVKSDASVVGFHCGYSAERVYKMVSFPDIPKDPPMYNREEILKRITTNLLELKAKIGEVSNKRIIIENLDYSRKNRKINWDIQRKEALEDRKKIEEMMLRYGTNSGILYVTDADFIREVIDNTKRIGFLFDIGHHFISSDAKISNKEYSGTIEDCFREMTEINGSVTYQLHINVPSGNEQEGYYDTHNPFKKGERLSDRVIDLTKHVFLECPEIQLITLEINTGLEAKGHVKEMIRQVEYLMRELNQ